MTIITDTFKNKYILWFLLRENQKLLMDQNNYLGPDGSDEAILKKTSGGEGESGEITELYSLQFVIKSFAFQPLREILIPLLMHTVF